ncbi:bifunctional 3'-5' exonuclease/DNA polymerase [Homoserinimonas sp. A520]
MHIALSSDRDDRVTITPIDGPGVQQSVTRAALPAAVALLEAQHPRWVWDDTSRWYPPLLAAGVRVERCVDLRLCRAILRNSELTAASVLATAAPDGWDDPAAADRPPDGLFDLDEKPRLDPVAEFARQQDAAVPAIGLLLAAESAGSLIAAEMHYAGLPWRADLHDELLTRTLGVRPLPGVRPAVMERVLDEVRLHLAAPELNPDSPVELLKALGRAGMQVSSTSKWELEKVKHPAIRPLLEYKKLARLLSANGWHWLETNVRDGRFRPEYVVGGVVTGRWASKGGGGALQLPKQIRGAVVADTGWKLVVADASQLEPRILAGMAADRGMVEAGSAGDLYAGIVARGTVKTRDEAKVAMLGAMYGATTGESGRLMPALTRAFPQAIGLVERAARAGERGEKVTTRLGRSSPFPGEEWHDIQSNASGEGATDAAQSRARTEARSWGRFTRNFVVQGTAAEWAMCWMASLRRSLHELAGGSWLTRSAHLVFFMHDEVVIHCPADQADAVAEAVRASAAEAGRLLFGSLPVEFPLTVAVVDNYGQAK